MRARLPALVVLGLGLGVAQGALLACAEPERPSALPATDGDAGARTTGFAQACARGTKRTAIPAACNGSPALCARTYDRVVVPMTHNANAVLAEGYAFANQTRGVRQQLADGVRGLMLDTDYFDPLERRDLPARAPDLSLPDQAYLCHGSCVLGSTRLLDTLCDVTAFLDEHRGEVVSVIFENRLADADTEAMLRAAGLSDYAYEHPAPSAPWPTLEELVRADRRLVVFVEQGGGAPAWLHPAWENVRDTPYAAPSLEAFSCALHRGEAGHPLFLVNHWVRANSHPAYAEAPNAEAFLGARVAQCTREAGRPPTFVGVDFYEVGGLFAVVRTANGL